MLLFVKSPLVKNRKKQNWNYSSDRYLAGGVVMSIQICFSPSHLQLKTMCCLVGWFLFSERTHSNAELAFVRSRNNWFYYATCKVTFLVRFSLNSALCKRTNEKLQINVRSCYNSNQSFIFLVNINLSFRYFNLVSAVRSCRSLWRFLMYLWCFSGRIPTCLICHL